MKTCGNGIAVRKRIRAGVVVGRVAAILFARMADRPRRRSDEMLAGPDGAPARAYLRAIGFSREDLTKPIIGVGHSRIETMTCNYNHRELAEHVKAGIREAGGTPMEFNTISISDGVTMGTEG